MACVNLSTSAQSRIHCHPNFAFAHRQLVTGVQKTTFGIFTSSQPLAVSPIFLSLSPNKELHITEEAHGVRFLVPLLCL
jgi:hypothetical protein